MKANDPILTYAVQPQRYDQTKRPKPTNIINLDVLDQQLQMELISTIYQKYLEKWLPDIKDMPLHTAFNVFGEFDGHLVDLVAYVNRKGRTCYVGNEFCRKGKKCRVKWHQVVLGRLPYKGEYFSLQLISISPREVQS